MSLPIDGERWLFLGPPKSGKSWFAASFPEPTVIDFDIIENKYAYKKCRQIGVDSLASADAALRKVGMYSFETLILDHLDGLVLAISEYLCSKFKVESVAKIGQGGMGWNLLSMTTIRWLKRFFQVAEAKNNLKASILISHCRTDKKKKSLVITDSIAWFVSGKVSNICSLSKEHADGKLRFWADLSGEDDDAYAGCYNPVLMNAGLIPNQYSEVVKLFGLSNKIDNYLHSKKIDSDKWRKWLEEECDITNETDVKGEFKKLRKSLLERRRVRSIINER